MPRHCLQAPGHPSEKGPPAGTAGPDPTRPGPAASSLTAAPGWAYPRGSLSPHSPPALTVPVKMSSPSVSLSAAPGASLSPPWGSGKGGGRRSAGEGEREPQAPPDAMSALPPLPPPTAAPETTAAAALTRRGGAGGEGGLGIGRCLRLPRPPPPGGANERCGFPPLAGVAPSPWKRPRAWRGAEAARRAVPLC